MKKIARLLLLLLVSLTPALADDFLIRLNPGSTLAALLARFGPLGLTLKTALTGSGQGLLVVTLPNGLQGNLLLQLLQISNLVQDVERDLALALPLRDPATVPPSQYPKLPSGVFTSPGYSLYFGDVSWNAYLTQPAASIVRLHQAHTMATGLGIIATVDTGADFNHPALLGTLVPGWDFTRGIPGGSESADVNQDTTPILDSKGTPVLNSDSSIVVNQDTTPILDQDTTPILDTHLPKAFGHGTMVAGVIHLTAPTARIMPVKAFDANGSGSLSNVIQAIYWAIDHGANAINMSFSTSSPSQELNHAIQTAAAHRVITVASAGNGGQNVLVYPAAYAPAIGVGSTTNQDTRSSFSNYGSIVTLAAPGEAIISPYPYNHYATAWGTSFSTPLVTGTVALLLQIDPTMSVAQATHRLQQAVPVDPTLGAGRLDIVQACMYALTHRGQY